MNKGKFRAFGNDLERDLDARLAGVLHAAFPPPAHDDPLRTDDFEKLAAALVLSGVEHTEANAIAAPDARIGLRHEHRTGVGAPPLRDSLGGRDGIEDDLR